MFYYLNSLYFYSLFGFVLESTIYKIHNSNRHSSIFYGPITMVYGFGVLLLLIAKKYILDKLSLPFLWKILIVFITCTFVFTFTEWLGGEILFRTFNISLWDYSNKIFHFGKYICLELAVIWGLLGTIYIYFVKDFIDNFIALIPKKLTIFFLFLNTLDTIFVFINKFPYW